MAQSLLQPLSVGNVVTTGFQLCKNRFQPYFLLALKAYFWLLVLIYGWAKFWAISVLISRLVYGELVNQPETITGAAKYVNSKLWQFLVVSVLFAFIGLGVWIILAIAFIIVSVLFTFLVPNLQPGSVRTSEILGTIAIVISTVGSVLILTRFFILELPLAIEDNINATSTIRRSWKLTKGFGTNILLISFVAFLINLPLVALVQIVRTAFQYEFSFVAFLFAFPLVALLFLADIIRRVVQFLFGGVIDREQIFNMLLIILNLCLSIVVGAIQLPFWQAVKAVVPYDLRTRKEGLGLKLRDRNI